MSMHSAAVTTWMGIREPAFRSNLIYPNRIKRDNYLPLFIQKMKNENLDAAVIKTFQHYYEQVLEGEVGMIGDDEISRIHSNELARADQLSEFTISGRKALNKTVRIVLNGGLGTSMGLSSVKSLIPAKGARSFLEIILNQAMQQGSILCFMNSFTTNKLTRYFIAANKFTHPIIHFIQNKYPKILRDNFAPAKWVDNPDLEWNPPGHGDIYTAMYASGTLRRLLESGMKYAFISNSDNLGGMIEASLLGYLVESKSPFVVEVARRNLTDIKGGHIAKRRDGRLVLREISQCPRKNLMNFQNIHYHCFFNTNNIWINLQELYKKIKTIKMVRLPMILNPKTLDPKDETSPAVYQIESAMGSAVSLFDDAKAILVERNRFFPVKTCNDLLILRSDRVLLNRNSKLLPNPECRNEGIEVRLDPGFYNKIDKFEQRFPYGPPSLVRCSSLTIEGDVRFERNIVLKGAVTIRNKRKNQESIKAGTILAGELIFE